MLEIYLPKAFNKEECSKIPQLAEHGIDCTCPFKIRAGEINLNQIEFKVPSAKNSIANFLTSGDFKFKIRVSDDQGQLACIAIQFGVKPTD